MAGGVGHLSTSSSGLGSQLVSVSHYWSTEQASFALPTLMSIRGQRAVCLCPGQLVQIVYLDAAQQAAMVWTSKPTCGIVC